MAWPWSKRARVRLATSAPAPAGERLAMISDGKAWLEVYRSVSTQEAAPAPPPTPPQVAPTIKDLGLLAVKVDPKKRTEEVLAAKHTHKTRPGALSLSSNDIYQAYFNASHGQIMRIPR